MILLDTKSIRIHGLTVSPYKTNCFIVETQEGSFIIDPAGDGKAIAEYLWLQKISVQFLIATHYHFDHVSAAHTLQKFGIGETLYLHPDERPNIKQANTYSLLLEKRAFKKPQSITLIDENFENHLKKMGFLMKHLPGHTPGHIILYTRDEKVLFPGDLIINNLLNISLTLFTEDKKKLRHSILQILDLFLDTTVIFPGHGRPSLMEVERRYNSKINIICGE
jgi:hydroxyacylglutathione hydrolase